MRRRDIAKRGKNTIQTPRLLFLPLLQHRFHRLALRILMRTA